MATREEMKKMLGMNEQTGGAIYKLDKVTMSGDDGQFKLTDLTTEREKGAKPRIEALGATVEGVILKMRWALSRWDEPSATFYSSTEYDDKWKDTVTVYPTKDKGSVETMKEKYKLSTQRIIYFYLTEQKRIVRLVVKASALSGKDKNPNGELGLFEYLNEFAEEESLPCEFITICTGVARAGTNADGSPNKRKDHVAMSFSKGKALTEQQFAKIQDYMIDVNEKTHAVTDDTRSTAEEGETADDVGEPLDNVLDEPKDAINPDDIPF